MRQSGVTTNQMLNAPVSSVYVWVNGHLDYPKLLARKLNRKDLDIVSPSRLDDPHYLRGKMRIEIILDHACALTDRQSDIFNRFNNRNQNRP